MKIGKVMEIINKHDFHIKKKFGQNFLVDDNILRKIVSCGDITPETGVIEIGPGLGSLTEVIAEKAKKVLCYEIDETLMPILKESLADFTNITVLNQDILLSDVDNDIRIYLNDCEKVVVIANLPYYITTPILLGMLEKTNTIVSYVVMMQKEVADRICSQANIKDYNSLSIAIQYRATAKKVLSVPKTVFIPAPNVDSSVVRLDRIEREKKPKDEDFFFNLVRKSFCQRRKTLVNNLSFSFNKPKAYYEKVLLDINLPLSIRSEALTIDDFILLSDILSKEA